MKNAPTLPPDAMSARRAAMALGINVDSLNRLAVRGAIVPVLLPGVPPRFRREDVARLAVELGRPLPEATPAP